MHRETTREGEAIAVRSYPIDDQVDLLCDRFEEALSHDDIQVAQHFQITLGQVSTEKRPNLLFWLLSIYLQHLDQEDTVERIELESIGLQSPSPDASGVDNSTYREVIADALDARHSHRLGLPFVPGFHIQSLAASGGQGEVYRAIQRQTEQIVAIKFLSRERLQFLTRHDAERVLRLLQDEIRTTAKLQHPNIVKVYDAGVCDSGVFFVMQWVQGGTLRDATNLSPNRICRLMADLTSALQHAHNQGVYHLDIKPQNILIDQISGQALLADFGLANLSAAADTLNPVIAGTPGYMAPEQIAGVALDQRTDLYALGVSFYEKLTGKRFSAESTANSTHSSQRTSQSEDSNDSGSSVHLGEVDATDQELLSICLRCTSVSPDDRYQSCLELSEALKRYVTTSDGFRIAEIGTRTIRMSPFLLFLNGMVWLQIQAGWAERIQTEVLIWVTMFAMYPMVFVVLGTLSKLDRHSPEHLALESLWSIWVGKCVAALAIAGSLRLFFTTLSTTISEPDLSAGQSAILLAYPMFSALTGFLMISLAPRYWRPLYPLGIVSCLHSFVILGATLLGTTLAPLLYGLAAYVLALIWGFHLKRLIPNMPNSHDTELPSTVVVNPTRTLQSQETAK